MRGLNYTVRGLIISEVVQLYSEGFIYTLTVLSNTLRRLNYTLRELIIPYGGSVIPCGGSVIP